MTVSGTTTAAGFTPITSATLTITDNDTAGVTIDPTTLTVTEEGPAVTYTVVLDSDPDGTVVVAIDSGSSPTAPVTVTPASLSFDSTDWGEAQTITVVATEDDDAVGGTRTLVHTVSSYSGVTSADAADVTVTVADDDTAPTEIVLRLSPDGAEEGAGPTVTVTAAFPGSVTLTDATVVTVAVGAGTDSATEGTDYDTVADLTVTIEAGATSGEGTFLFAVTDDAIAEPDETVTVSGTTTAAGFTPITSATLTITDNDTAGVTIDPTTLTVTEEGEAATYTVVLDSDPDGTVVVAIDLGSSPTAPITVTPTSLSFDSTDWGEAQTVTVEATEDNDAVGGTRTLVHTVSSYSGVTSADAADVTVTVNDDDTAPTEIVLRLNPDGAEEGAGPTVMVTAAFPGSVTLTDATVVTVVVGAGTDSATEGTDYTEVADLTVTIAAGATSGEGTFLFAVMDDAIADPDETVTVSGTTTAAGFTPITSATLTITDNDTAGVTIDPTTLTVTEEGPAVTYTVVLDSDPDGTVVVAIDLGSSTTAPITVTPTSLSFDSTDWSEAQTVTVEATEDNDAVGGTRTLVHTVSSYSGVTSADAADVTVTVNDDDTAPTEIVLRLNPDGAEEGAGPTVTVTAAFPGSVTLTDATVVTVAVGAGTDSATEGTDYTEVVDLTVTIEAGATSGTGTFQFAVMDDAIADPDETVTVSGTTTAAGFTTITSATLTITDNDTAGVTISETAVEVTEEGPAVTYTVVLESDPDGTVVVAIDSGSSTTAPITVSPTSLSFDSDTWAASQTVTVVATEDDDAVGGTRTLVHTVSNYPGVTSADAADVTVTVADNDTAPTAIVLRLSPDRAEEGTGPTVTVTAAFPGSVTLTDATVVTVAVGAGTDSATEGTDYTEVVDLTVTIEAGATSGTGTFQFAVMDDAIADPDETVTVSGTTTAAGFTTITSATLTITDNDTAGVTISETAVEVTEEGPAATYTVVLDSDPDGTVVVAIDSGSSTTAPITVSPTSLSFDSDTWAASQTVTVVATEDDDAVGGTRTLVHAVSNYPGVTSADAADVTVTVADNDTAPTAIVLRLSPDRAEEGTGPTVTVTAAFPGSVTLTDATVVTVAVGAGTDSATEGTDYTEVVDLTVTIAAGATSGDGHFPVCGHGRCDRRA